jgi:hypothetical protein
MKGKIKKGREKLASVCMQGRVTVSRGMQGHIAHDCHN